METNTENLKQISIPETKDAFLANFFNTESSTEKLMHVLIAAKSDNAGIFIEAVSRLGSYGQKHPDQLVNMHNVLIEIEAEKETTDGITPERMKKIRSAITPKMA